MRPVSTILVPTGKLCVSKFYKQKKKIVDNAVALFFLFPTGLYEMIVNSTSTQTLCFMQRNLQNG